MMTRRREERRRGAEKKLMVLGAIVGCVLLIAAWLAWAAVNVSPQLDSQFCPSENEIPGNALLVLDATDPWSDVRELAIRREVSAILASLERFTRVAVHVVEPASTPGGTGRLSACNPGTITQIEQDSRDFQLPRQVVSNEELVQSYRAQFDALIDSVVADVANVPEQSTSPIIETIREAVLTFPDAPPGDIYIISDMYQNSSLYSAYRRDEWNVEVADSLADVYVQGTQALSGANVTIFLLSPSDVRPNPDAIRRFWNRFFSEQGAILQRVERVEG